MLNTLRRGRRTLLALCLGLVASFGAQATYSNVYFFGDSLSDTGNVYTASGGAEPLPPYYNGRFSNGPLWVETVASGLGLASAANPFLQGGNNYAWAGAFTGTSGLADPLLGIPTGLQTQVVDYWAPTHPSADANANALYVVEIGGNDLYGIAAAISGVSPADYAARLAGAQLAVSNLIFSLNFLIDHGARNFLIANVPNLGVTPLGSGFQVAATDVSTQYNNLLTAALGTLGGNPNIVEFDLFDLITDVVTDAQAGGQTYGMSNGSAPCIFNLSTCEDSVFFDPQHPTTQVHALAGQAALALLVPEPKSSLLLVATALLLAVLAIRRRGVRARRATLSPTQA